MSRQEKTSYKHTFFVDGLLRLAGAFPFLFGTLQAIRRRNGNTLKAKVLVISDSKILMVKSIAEPHIWTLPGGTVKRGESVQFAAIREIREELGIRLSKAYLEKVGILLPNETSLHDEYVIFNAIIKEQSPVKLGIELLEAAWFDTSHLPDGGHFIHYPLVANYLKNYE